MGIKILRILLIGSLAGFSLLNTTETKAETEIETNETENETEVETVKPSYSHEEVMEAIRNEVRYTQNWVDKGEDDTIQISQSDAEMLLKVAAAEAGGEDINGQLIVMQSVWNRVQLQDDYYRFPNTISDVIYQKNAFTSVSEGKFDTAEPNYRTHLALAQFESNKNLDNQILGFETKGHGKTLLNYFDYYYTYGGHDVFKAKKRD